ncbi:MAG: hypothetical protein HY958_09190 [Bacteroidia bacterium]|nr:hypothetical protein [Bacteroidia bacterium]
MNTILQTGYLPTGQAGLACGRQETVHLIKSQTWGLGLGLEAFKECNNLPRSRYK